MSAIHSALGSGEPNDAFGLQRFFRVTAAETGGTLAIFEEMVPEGAGPPLHIHHTETEVFTVLDGALRFHADGKDITGKPGDIIVIPPGTRHAFKGIAPGTSRVLIQLTPGEGANFFVDIATEDLHPPDDMDRITQIAARYGVEFVGPPLD
ncbi:cupin domain-containing protein [Aestuariibius sp. 2305UL40-4]|uniref:cupin domain-containing protein n=1 Tax=Aestuariibius violaceus TaxID=3234132 RepID=UPI00345E7063